MKTDLRSVLEAVALAAATSLMVPACDDDDNSNDSAANDTETGSPGTSAGCPGTEAGCPGAEAGCPGAEAGCPGTEAGCPGTEAGCPGAARPDDVEAVLAAIEDESYAEWEAEPAPHPPVGNSPHPGEVRTFFNEALAESMGAGNTEHPVGSAAVKESWVDGELNGWFAEVKVSEGTGQETWYWWSDLAGVDALGGEDSVAGCVGCHSAGVDYVTTVYPFEE